MPGRRTTLPVLLTGLALTTLLAACEDGRGGGLLGNTGILEDVWARDRTVTYRCDEDRRFVADFEGGDRVEVELGGSSYDLRRDDRGSSRGDRREYVGENDGNEIRLTVEGDEAYLRIEGGRDFRDCRERA
ncbi:MAG TPA: hypothetical protein VFG43_06255 [Geminicoccaceae bacterium]|nr:hypothetical protein [Geminicoccaceae bacterium]